MMKLGYIIVNQNQCLQKQKSLRHKIQLENSWPLIFWDALRDIFVDFFARKKQSTLKHISRPYKNFEQESDK